MPNKSEAQRFERGPGAKDIRVPTEGREQMKAQLHEAQTAIDVRHDNVIALRDRPKHTLDRAREGADVADLKEIDETQAEMDLLFKKYDAIFAELHEQAQTAGITVDKSLKEAMHATAKAMAYDRTAQGKNTLKTRVSDEKRDATYLQNQDPRFAEANETLIANHEVDEAQRQADIRELQRQKNKKTEKTAVDSVSRKVPDKQAAEAKKEFKPQIIKALVYEEPDTDVNAGFEQTKKAVDEEWDNALEKNKKTEVTRKEAKAPEENVRAVEKKLYKEVNKQKETFQKELAVAGLDNKTIAIAGSLFSDLYNGYTSPNDIAATMVLLSARGVEPKALAEIHTFIKKHAESQAPSPEQIAEATKRIGLEGLKEEASDATQGRAKKESLAKKATRFGKRAINKFYDTPSSREESSQNLGDRVLTRKEDAAMTEEAEARSAQSQKEAAAEAAAVNRVNDRLNFYKEGAETYAKDRKIVERETKEWNRLFDKAEIAYISARNEAIDQKFGKWYGTKDAKELERANKDRDAMNAGLDASAQIFADAGKDFRDIKIVAEQLGKTAFAEKYMPREGNFEKALHKTSIEPPVPPPTVWGTLKGSLKKMFGK